VPYRRRSPNQKEAKQRNPNAAANIDTYRDRLRHLPDAALVKADTTGT
jgi:hypothetical protein